MTTSNSPRRPIRPPRNLTGELASRLTEEIVAGALAPHTRLPTEHAMMQTYGVSRTVVREAIAALRSEGLVETRQGSGAYVAADPRRRPFRIDPEGLSSVKEVLNVLELRMAVEVEAAGLAAERRSEPDIARLRELGAAFGQAVATGDPATDLDYEFHAAVGGATGNSYFRSFLDFIGRIIIPRRTVRLDGDDGEPVPYLVKIREEHDAITAAIAAGDPAAARAAMREHLTRSRSRYRGLIEAGGA